MSGRPGGSARARLVVAAFLTLMFLVATPQSVPAQTVPAPTVPAPTVPAPIANISPELNWIPMSAPDLDALDARRRTLIDRRTALEDRRRLIDASIMTSAADRVHLQSISDRTQQRRAVVARQLGATRDDAAVLARRSFVEAAANAEPSVFDAFEPEGLRRDSTYRQVLSTYAADNNVSESRVLTARLVQLDAEVERLGRRVNDIEVARLELERRRAEADDEARSLDVQIVQATLAADAARGAAIATEVDIPMVVLDAYHRATQRLAIEQRACGLQWWMLAGIGRTESNHGRFAGSMPGRDGRVNPPIVGIPLDGTNNTRFIGDTDGGALDGDPVVDRAVGPMQFIPGTWRSLGVDGSGDGVADPHNIYDAAYAAARYLCRNGPGLDRPEVLERAVSAYAGVSSYLSMYLPHAARYRAALPELVRPPSATPPAAPPTTASPAVGSTG